MSARPVAGYGMLAALTFLRVEFSKTHNLDLLRSLLPGDWQARSAYHDLAELTAWAVEARYPGDWPEPTGEDARQALETAVALTDVLATDLARRGC